MKEPDAEDGQVSCVESCINILSKLEKSVNYHYEHKSCMTNKNHIRVRMGIGHSFGQNEGGEKTQKLSKSAKEIEKEKEELVIKDFLKVYNTLYECSTQYHRPRVQWRIQNDQLIIYSTHSSGGIVYLEDIVKCLFQLNIVPYLNEISKTLVKVESIVEYWKTFKSIFLNTLRKLFSNVISESKYMPDRIAFQKFYDLIVGHREEEIVRFAIATINEYREKKDVERRNRALNVMEFINEMEQPMMMQKFFLAMLKGSQQYYKAKANAWIGQKSLIEYATQLRDYLDQEQQFINRISYTFPIRNKLIKYTIEYLVTDIATHFLKLSGSGVHHLLDNQLYQQLKFVADVISPSPAACQELGIIYKQYILNRLKELYNGQVIELQAYVDIQKIIRHLLSNYIPKILSFFEELHIVQDCFKTIPECRQSLHDGMNFMLSSEFEVLEEKESLKTDLLFAFYCDEIINHHHAEHEAQEKLKQIANLMNQFMAADIFLDEYRCLLAKRLIAPNASRREALERYMITQLKSAPMSQVNLYKLDYLVNERAKTMHSMQQFQHYLEEKQTQLPISFQLSVFSTGYWPLAISKVDCHLPPALAQAKQAYTNFYQSQFGTEKRLLTWLHGHSSTVLIGRFDVGQKQFLSSLFHAIILITFNQREQFTVGELLQHTGIPKPDLVQSLASLCSKKCRILIPSESKLSNVNTIFRLNTSFHHTAKKIKIPSRKITVNEFQRQKAAIGYMRRHMLEAAIVHQVKRERKCPIKKTHPVGDWPDEPSFSCDTTRSQTTH